MGGHLDLSPSGCVGCSLLRGSAETGPNSCPVAFLTVSLDSIMLLSVIISS